MSSRVTKGESVKSRMLPTHGTSAIYSTKPGVFASSTQNSADRSEEAGIAEGTLALRRLAPHGRLSGVHGFYLLDEG